MARTKVGTTNSPRPSARRHRSAHRVHEYSSEAAGNVNVAARRPLRGCLQPVCLLSADIGHKLEVLGRHCDTEGRDPFSIEKTILATSNPLDDPDRFVAEMADYSALGIDAVELMPSGDPIAYVTQVGERLVPALAQLASEDAVVFVKLATDLLIGHFPFHRTEGPVALRVVSIWPNWMLEHR